MGKIFLNNLRFFAYHGVLEEEHIIGRWFSVDLEVAMDFSSAAKNDVLEGTINYQSLYDVVANEMKKPSNLIEHVGERIITALKSSFHSISYSKVRVYKHAPPFPGAVDSVAIEIETHYKP